jgi:hypothetical protein
MTSVNKCESRPLARVNHCGPSADEDAGLLRQQQRGKGQPHDDAEILGAVQHFERDEVHGFLRAILPSFAPRAQYPCSSRLGRYWPRSSRFFSSLRFAKRFSIIGIRSFGHG